MGGHRDRGTHGGSVHGDCQFATCRAADIHRDQLIIKALCFDAHGVGALIGLTLSTTRAEIFRAFLEGITYEMKWNLSILSDAGFELSELRAVGGGSKSAAWMQIKADILGLPLTVMHKSRSAGGNSPRKSAPLFCPAA